MYIFVLLTQRGLRLTCCAVSSKKDGAGGKEEKGEREQTKRKGAPGKKENQKSGENEAWRGKSRLPMFNWAAGKKSFFIYFGTHTGRAGCCWPLGNH